ncbi:TPA: hypothetical protein DCW56_04075 [Candidatus Peregrinibacteria bacterium]|nr:MAG: hypothetical protein UW03_C0025G0016 [Candidatus Peregrinibacteria bacterium GW2011_GWA2_43_8]HAU40084.1 hypothetical protein [Candidatus Peregrinibacteria bacterium]
MGSKKSNKKKIALLIAVVVILGVVLFGTATNYMGALKIKTGSTSGTKIASVPTTLTIVGSTVYSQEDQIAAQEENNLLIAVFKATAIGEDWTISKLSFSPTDSGGTNAANLVDCIDSMTLQDGTSTSVTATKSGSIFTFSGMNMLVPEDDSIYIELYADLATHSNDGGGLDSDDALYFTLSRNDFEATGTTSGKFTAISSATTTNATYVYRSTPTVANATSLGTSLIAGADQEVYRFTVAADSEGDIILGYMSLQTVVSGIETSNDLGYDISHWQIREHGTGAILGEGGYYDPDQATYLDLTMGGTTDGVTIPAGTSKTFSVFTDIYEDDDIGTMATISTRIYEDRSHEDTDGLNNIVASGLDNMIVGIVWSDLGSASGSHGTGIDEWMNGYKVQGMPVSYTTLS